MDCLRPLLRWSALELHPAQMSERDAPAGGRARSLHDLCGGPVRCFSFSHATSSFDVVIWNLSVDCWCGNNLTNRFEPLLGSLSSECTACSGNTADEDDGNFKCECLEGE